MATRDPGSGSVGSDPSKSVPDASPAPAGEDGGHPIRNETRRLAEQAKERARTYASERKQVAADRVGSVAQALRNAADSLRGQDQSSVADYVGQAADGLDRVSTALRDRDLGALARHAQDLARRQPTLLIGGAMIAGFLLARFARASGDESNTQQMAAGMSESGQTEMRAHPAGDPTRGSDMASGSARSPASSEGGPH